MSCVYEETAICVVASLSWATEGRAGGSCACFVAPSPFGDLTLEQ